MERLCEKDANGRIYNEKRQGQRETKSKRPASRFRIAASAQCIPGQPPVIDKHWLGSMGKRRVVPSALQGNQHLQTSSLSFSDRKYHHQFALKMDWADH
jgi:hypothetical protein